MCRTQDARAHSLCWHVAWGEHHQFASLLRFQPGADGRKISETIAELLELRIVVQHSWEQRGDEINNNVVNRHVSNARSCFSAEKRLTAQDALEVPQMLRELLCTDALDSSLGAKKAEGRDLHALVGKIAEVVSVRNQLVHHITLVGIHVANDIKPELAADKAKRGRRLRIILAVHLEQRNVGCQIPSLGGTVLQKAGNILSWENILERLVRKRQCISDLFSTATGREVVNLRAHVVAHEIVSARGK